MPHMLNEKKKTINFEMVANNNNYYYYNNDKTNSTM